MFKQIFVGICAALGISGMLYGLVDFLVNNKSEPTTINSTNSTNSGNSSNINSDNTQVKKNISAPAQNNSIPASNPLPSAAPPPSPAALPPPPSPEARKEQNIVPLQAVQSNNINPRQTNSENKNSAHLPIQAPPTSSPTTNFANNPAQQTELPRIFTTPAP